MLIELYGLPGSGKTTLAYRLSDATGYPVVKIRSKADLIKYNILFMIRRPRAFFSQLYPVLMNAVKPSILYYKLMNTWLDYNGKYMKARAANHAIMDQGHFTNVLAVFESGLSAEAIKKYAARLPKPDLLIVMDIPRPVREAHVRARGSLSRAQFGEQYVMKWMEGSENRHKSFVSVLPQLGLVYRIVRNKTDEEALIAELQGVTESSTPPRRRFLQPRLPE